MSLITLAHFTEFVNAVNDDFLQGIKLDDHQVKSLRAACSGTDYMNEIGCFDIPTGGGKGEIIAGIAKMFSCPTVVVCDQTVVIQQLKERLELRKVAEEVGMFFSGRRPDGQMIIVGTIQSLACPTTPPSRSGKDTDETYNRKLTAHNTRVKNSIGLRNLIKKCELLIVDECDKASSKTFKSLFRFWFNGRRRYGFSGTMYDPDKPVENLVLKEHLGSVLFKEYRKNLEAINRIIPVEYRAIAFGDPSKKHSSETLDIAEKEQMIENVGFHNIVTSLVNHETNRGHGVLILVEKIELGEALKASIAGSEFICGVTSKSKRREIIAKFESREIKVLIGGKIVKRGLDLKGGCEAMIIATGGKLWSDFDQKVGRAVRMNKRGKSTIYDFYFMSNRYLYAHSRRRVQNIVKMDYKSVILFPGGAMEAQKLIDARWRVPKHLLTKSR